MMRIRRTSAVSAVFIVIAASGPAYAATTGPTTTAFTVTSGALAITVPPSTVTLGSGAPGTQITAQLGAVQVTDARALLAAAWTGSVTSTNFTTGGATGPETVPVADVAYWSGPATATSGSGTFTPGQAATGNKAALSATVLTAFTLTAGVGSSSATWNPTLVVSVPAAAVAGLYTGTVTHSVA